MSTTPMQNNSEASLETLLEFHVIRRRIYTLFFQDNVRQIFVDYAVDFIEIFEDFVEAVEAVDVDRLYRILMQILEFGEEDNDENYATNMEMNDFYEVVGEENTMNDDSDIDDEENVENRVVRRFFRILGPRLSTRLSYLRDTDGDNEDEDEDLPPLNSEEIETLEKGQVTQEMLVRIPKCLICLEAFNKDEEVISLLCEHFYHCNCINNWLKIRPTCPMCRGNPRERE